MEALARGLVREYLVRKGLKDVLAIFDAEAVRQPSTVWRPAAGRAAPPTGRYGVLTRWDLRFGCDEKR